MRCGCSRWRDKAVNGEGSRSAKRTEKPWVFVSWGYDVTRNSLKAPVVKRVELE